MSRVFKNELRELQDVLQSDVGAPMPEVFADEGTCVVTYYLSAVGSPDRRAAVRFKRCVHFVFGGLNDEALDRHPLYANGLESYSAYEVIDSRWAFATKVFDDFRYDYERPPAEVPDVMRHFILTFHDSMFECIADSYTVHPLRCVDRDQTRLALSLLARGD